MSEPAAPPASIVAVFRRLWPEVWRYRVRVGVALLFLVAAKLANIGVPVVLKELVDALDIAPKPLLVPLLMLVAYGALRLSASLFQELRQIVFARVLARTSRRITLRVFEHLHALSLRFHLDRRTGGVARNVERGMTATSDLLDWTIYTILPTLLEVSIVCGILIVRYDWSFAAITLSTLVVYIAFTFSVTEWRLRYYRAANAADTEANAHAVDSLLNYETVKYFGNERHEFARYDGSLVKLEEATVKSLKTLAVLASALPSFPNLTIGLVAIVFVMAGLCFRVAAVPLHFYAPDVYQGSPAVIAAMLSWIPKVVGFVAMIRVLTVVDTYPRFSPAADPRFSDRAEDVVATLEKACAKLGYPKTIRVDQGSEFVSRDLDLWTYAKGVTLDFSRPGKSTDTDVIE